MYRSIAEFVADWKYESGATRRMMESLTDASLEQRVCPDGRTLGFLAWHLVLSLGEMGGHAGLSVAGPEKEMPVPDKASAITDAYRTASQALGRAVRAQWDDAGLAGEIDMYGQRWTRAKVLLSLIRHQAHHRGQMTVLMRQAGLPVPGVYGPSREEWASLGRPPHA